MVVGDEKDFPYRSGPQITRFFKSCGLAFQHNGETRWRWTYDRLVELSAGPAAPGLPSDDLCKVISRLFEPDDFARAKENTQALHPADVNKAVETFNGLFKKHEIVASLDSAGRCFLKSAGTGASSESYAQQARPLSQEDLEQRRQLAAYLDRVSEDEFIEKVLVPLFQGLGFRRVSPTGHRDKSLEYGKDLWMKFQLPTGHWLYFCAQVKKDKIDSNNASGQRNVGTVLSQARMAFDHPIFDPEANTKVLLDHLFIISAKEITKAAKSWLAEQLDASQRRQIIFMGRDEMLDHAARILRGHKIEKPLAVLSDEDIPF